VKPDFLNDLEQMLDRSRNRLAVGTTAKMQKLFGYVIVR
jgi:hypothetical protein